MDVSQFLSTLSCELKIIRAKNTEFIKSSGDLFVRCYLSAGDNRRVQLNSKEISAKSDLYWNQSFSLDCLGTDESINSLRQGTVVFELRWRSSATVFGKKCCSKLKGRAEIPWKNVFESPNMEIETWAWMASKNNSCLHEDVKPPAVQVRMKIRVPAEKIKRAKNDRLMRRWDECGCMDNGCHSCVDYDIFAIGFALEAM